MMEIIYRKTSDLIPYVNNARTHDEEQVTQIASSIKEFGFTNPVLIDLDSGIIAGHGRVKAAQKLNLDELPCIVLKDLSEAQKKAYIIADNKLALNSGWNEDLLKIEIEELQGMDFDIDLLGFDSTELDDILSLADSDNEGLTDPDEVPETPDKAISIQGDLWLLGNHRLMCGDSTEQKSVTKLMDDKTIDMIFTDPTYGVSVVGSNQKNGSVGGSKPFGKVVGNNIIKANLYEKVIGDDSLETAKKSIEIINFIDSEIKIIWGGNYFTDYLNPSPCWIVWDKERTGNFADFEMAWTDQKKPSKIFRHQWNGLIKASEKKERRVHPTQKPCALAEWCFSEFTDINTNIMDLFGGSGSTLIACEKTNRHCFMMELAEHYCDVIIKRWQDFTGKEATHEETGKTFNQLIKERS